ncbi:MAG: metallophosphoesterase [Acidobacteriaceae bacterium]|nr:metallophosphoesterase [Acidobacteriaceae bacterium]MBV9308010.1 metallophosphoesterase [Acidobacteriaceae bacterium]
MKNRRIQAYAVSFVVFLFLLPSTAIAASKVAEQKFVWLSDIHFNPLADPAFADKLAAADAAQWPSILAGSSLKFSTFGQDTNWRLLASAISEVKKTVPDAAFTIITGDLLVHHFRERFDGSASVHDDIAFRSFVLKTTRFITSQLKQIAPSQPVFITLGNNDSDCGDYSLQPDGEFLRGTLPVMADLLKTPASSLPDWMKYGVYSVPHPSLRHYRIIAVNTVLFSARYRNACGDTPGDPGEELLSWLDAELSKAKQNHEKVWLIYHIPPGIDGFATTRHADMAVPFWKAQYAEEFDRLLSRYHETIAVNLAGHTHMDDFRLLAASTPYRSLVLITPGLSPNVNQNPAFRVVQFQRNGTLTDEATYYLSNLLTTGDGTGPEWKLEYSFDQLWGFHQLNYKNFEKLYRRIDVSPGVRKRWTAFYSVSHPEGGSITDQSFWALHCASGHSTISDYQACVSAK